MRLRVEIDATPFSVKLETIQITKQLAGRSSTCTFELPVSVASGGYDSEAVYDTAVYDGDTEYSFSAVPQQLGEVIIYNDDDDTKIFRGFITAVVRTLKSKSYQVWSISCVGLEYLLANISINRSWTGKTDREIIQDAFGDVLPEITTLDATVSELSVALDYEAKDQTLTELVENLSKISGAEWRVSESKQLLYRASGSVDAPFGFAAAPDDSHSPPLKKWIITSRERRSETFANRVTVLGAFADTDGAELRSTADNLVAQAEQGRIFQAIVVARDIDNQTALDLASSIELERRGVQETISFDFFEDGLEVGDLVEVVSPLAGLNDSYVVNTLTVKQTNQTDTRYSAQIGDYRGSLAERIRQLDRIKTGPKFQPPVAPPSGSIGEGMLADGAVTRLKLAAQAVSDAQVDLAGLSRLATASVLNTTIADNAISTPKLQANSVDTLQLNSLSINASKIQVASLVGNLFQAHSIDAADAVFAVAAIGHADIGSVSASSMTLGTLTVGSGVDIAGTLSVGSSLTVTGTISGSDCDLTNLNASHITTGSLTVGSGGISVSGNISGALLDDGSVAAVKISSVDAGSISTGTLAVGSGGITVTGNISGALLDDGSVDSVKISSIDADKINAGTITAEISLNSGGFFQCSDTAQFFSGVQMNDDLGLSGDLLMSGGNITSAHNIGCVAFSAGTIQDSVGSYVMDGLGVLVAPVNTSSLKVGGVTVGVFSQQSGPGSVSFTTVADVQTWCIALLSQLQATGIIT